MGRARELTMGPRRGRTPVDPRIAELRRLTRATNPDVDALRALIDDVAANTPRAMGRHLGEAWMAARDRYAELTGIVTPGPSSPFLARLKATR